MPFNTYLLLIILRKNTAATKHTKNNPQIDNSRGSVVPVTKNIIDLNRKHMLCPDRVIDMYEWMITRHPKYAATPTSNAQ